MSERKLDQLMRKIHKMYENYGLDVSNMSEDEIDRIKDHYLANAGQIDSDLKKSEQYAKMFDNDII